MISRGRFFLGIILIILISAIFFFPGFGKPAVEVDVYSGTTGHKVLNELINRNILRSKYPFLIWAKLRKGANKIKVGRYHFRKGQSAYWILDDLIRGKTVKIRIVIPEGFASWQIAERLEENKITPARPFLDYVNRKKFEGFLFPATYDLDLGLQPDAVAQFLKNEFDKRWTPEIEARARERGWSQAETVTLASIIEREVMIRDELPKVSALYNNRLKKNMPLEADPTVQYALGFWKERLFYSDYRDTKSPYNTYLHRGLPPGPICNPGLDAIEAALWPEATPYLYMVADSNGLHDFSETYREHVNKVNKRNRLRRLEKKKAAK